ncbi:hypothetical protein [Chryseobacterium sp.]|uniref:hypothetical protein n=1 Tax=Chryseobacterium sp. TaxID=1871047 RepID=UPI000EEA7F74|nr:hypothetical protein [Chryseobacterium sp.]HCA06137.1 hypothetical protein [Chryseobacterium sp.]
MKKIFLPLVLLTSIITYSQVGINSSTPSASLDLVSKGNTNATKALEINDSTNKELVSVSDTGVLRLENYKNYSFLGTDANGNLGDGAALNIPSIAGAGEGKAAASDSPANGVYQMTFVDTIKINSANLSYSNGIFTVLKAGYYSITASTFIALGAGGGSAVSRIYQNSTNVSKVLTFHESGTSDTGHTISYTGKFIVGDKIRVEVGFTRNFRLTNGSISLVYYGT